MTMLALPSPAEDRSPHEFSPSIDTRALLRAVAARRGFVAAWCFVSLFLALLYYLSATQTFQADALLRVQSGQGFVQNILDKQQAPPPMTMVSPALDESQVLGSRAILGPVVDSFKLYITAEPIYFPLIGRGFCQLSANLRRLFDTEDGSLIEPLWPEYLGKYAWGGEDLEVVRFDLPERWEDRKFILTALAEEGHYSVSKGKQTLIADGKVGDTLEVHIGDVDTMVVHVQTLTARPGTQFRVTRSTLPATLRALRKALKIKTNDKDSQVIELTVEGTDQKRVAPVLNELIATYEKLTKEWDTQEAKQRLSFLESQLPEVKQRLESAEEKLNGFRTKQRTFDFSAEAKALLGETVKEETQLAQLAEKRAVLRQKFTQAYSDFGPMDAQISAVKSTLSKLNQRAAALPGAEQTQLRYMRDVEVNKKLYIRLLNNLHEQQVATAGSVPAVRIIDLAMAPDKPSWPKPLIIFPASLLGGLLISLVTIFAKAAWKTDVINDSNVVEHIFGGPVFAHIPFSRTEQLLFKRKSRSRPDDGQNLPLLAQLYPDDGSVESLRSLRTIMSEKLSSARNNVVMLTSPGSGMGKSFVTANLAAVFAAVGKRVLVIDADLRRGRLHQVFGLARSPGLSELAARDVTLKDVIALSSVHNVYLVPRGNILAQRPTELLAQTSLHAEIKSVSRNFDIVLIDTPPVLDVADAAILGRVAGTVVLLVKAGTVTMPEAYESFKQLKMSGVNVDGYVINALDSASDRGVYGYRTYAEVSPYHTPRLVQSR